MEAHRSYEHFERNHEAAAEGGHPSFVNQAALVVAVLAAFLAVASFLGNKAVKEVVTGETHRAESTARLEDNLLKTDVAEGNADLLRVLGAEGGKQARAAAEARVREAKIEKELVPADTRLRHQIVADEHHVSDYDSKHLAYELAEVGLEIGIVLASVSIIMRRRWLLSTGAGLGAAGVVALLIGLLG
jgi:hypothetical protein